MIIAGCVDINTLENEEDYVMRAAVTTLFEGENDAIEVVRRFSLRHVLDESTYALRDRSGFHSGSHCHLSCILPEGSVV